MDLIGLGLEKWTRVQLCGDMFLQTGCRVHRRIKDFTCNGRGLQVVDQEFSKGEPSRRVRENRSSPQKLKQNVNLV